MDIHPKDVEHDDLVGDVLIRILSARVIDDVQCKDKKDQALWLDVELLPDELFYVCQKAEESFQHQDTLLELERTLLPIHVVADLHGQVSHLLRLLRTIGSPQKETYLFLGDYVDRGVQGIELMVLLLCLKIRYPFQVFLLRGNHEDVNTNLNYGFYEECLRRCPRDQNLGEKLWRAFLSVFNWMPLAAIVSGKRGRIFCCHGGISPFINRLEDINTVERPNIVPPFGIGCDLVWSDPGTQSGWQVSHRGISFVFGQDVLEHFCRKHNIDIVLRGHQITEKMYRFGYRMNPGGRLVTLFSAPNYMNYRNNGAVIRIDSNLRLQYKVYRVKTYSLSEIVPKKKSSLTLFNRKRSSKSQQKRVTVDADTEVDPESVYKPARRNTTSSNTAENKSSMKLPLKTDCEDSSYQTIERTSAKKSSYEELDEAETQQQLVRKKKKSQVSKRRD